MASLRDILGRSKDEILYMVLVTGYPKKDAQVPDIGKKSLDDIAMFV